MESQTPLPPKAKQPKKLKLNRNIIEDAVREYKDGVPLGNTGWRASPKIIKNGAMIEFKLKF